MKDNNTIPKGFKMTELGLLPEEWDVVRLGIYCRVFGGYAFKSSDFSNEGTPIIKIGNLQDGTIIIDKRTNFYPKEKITQNLKRFILKTNDILIALTGATTGKVAVFPKDFESALLNQRVGKFDVYHENLNKLFVRFYSITKNFQEGIRGNILQSAQGNVSPKQIDNLRVPLPPLPEQKKIAAVLSTVEAAKEKAGGVIEAARELRKSLMKYLFTYGSVPVEEAENVSLKETEIGLIPEGWEVVRLRDIVKKTEQKDPKKNLKWRFKYIDVSSISRGNVKIIDYKLCQGKNAPSRAKKLVKNEDVIFATVRPTLKRLALINEKFDGEICSTAFCVLRAKENILKPLYLFYGVGRNVFIDGLGKIQRGASYPAVKDSDVKNQRIPLPPLHIQQKIAKILSTVDEKIETEENKKKALEELFKTLLNNLMTARIRVNHLRIAV